MLGTKFIDMLKIDCFARKYQFNGALLALHANIWLYGRIFHNNRIFLQNINISDQIRSKQPNIKFVQKQPNVDLFRSFELAYQCMEMLNKRWYHIHSHQHCPNAPRLCCRFCVALQSVQIVQSASLHSFKLVFLVSART